MYLNVAGGPSMGPGLGAAPRASGRVVLLPRVIRRPGFGAVIVMPARARGMRGLGLTCPAGYYVSGSSLLPAAQTCAPTIETLNLANPNSGENLAFSQADPGSPAAVFFATYGGLTNDQQNAVVNCQEWTGANAITGEPIPPQCAAILSARSPGVPGSVIQPLLNTSPAPPPAAPPKSSSAPVQPWGTAQTNPSGWAAYIQAMVAYNGGSSAPPAAPDKAASVSIVNKSHAGANLLVGDSWELTVTGSPNRPVSATVTQSGQASSTAAFGNTDSSGNLVVRGTMDASTVGTWREMWTVGTAAAPVLSFTVAAAPAGSKGAPAPGPSDGSSQTPAPATSNSLTDFLSNTFDVFGFNIPYWAAGLVVGGVGVMALRGGKR